LPTAASLTMIGQTISHFEILERLGQGGMGLVYKARDLRLDRLVALKFLPPHLDADTTAEQRFLREARTASALDHANICTIYEIGQAEDGRTFIAMAYCDGETLKQRIARGPVPAEEAMNIVGQVARGLAEAHAHGVIHRDIKPGNIAITQDGTAKILDFGVATLVGAARITQDDSTSGTAAYMSPEQARGGPVDHRTDIWSLGVVMFEMLTGEPPFPGEHPQAVIFSILHNHPKSASNISWVPARLGAIVERALSKDPSLRHQSAEELLSELAANAPSESPTLTMRVPPRDGRAGRFWRSRRPAVVLVASVGLLALWAVWRFLPRPSGPNALPSSTSIVVLPFSFRGSAQYRYLGDGMVDLLSAKLDHAGGLHSIDPRAVAGVAARESVLDPEHGRLLAERLGAQHLVLGSIVEVGGKVQIDATLYRAQGGPEPTARTTASGDVTKAFDLVDELAIGLLAEFGQGSSARTNRVAAVTTSSLPAFRAYLDGQSAFQRGDFRSSVEAFRKAVELDGQFALAWYRLSVALEWLGTPQELHTKAAEQAYRYADHLTDRDRRLLEASRVWREGANQEAKRLYTAIVHDYPDEIEGWYQLGEVLFHRNALYGDSFTDSRSAFERVLSYEPNHFASLVHLARIEAFDGRLEPMRSLVERSLKLGEESADHTLAIRALEAFALDDSPQQKQVLAELERADGPALAMAFLEVSLYARNLRGAERVARLLVVPSRPPRVRSYGQVALAHLSLAHGKWAEARNELAAIASFDPWASLEYRALFSCLSFLPASRAQLSEIRDGLRGLDPTAAPRVENPAVFIDAHYDLHPLLRMYLMALVSARMGDVERAVQYAGEIEKQNFPPGYKSLAADFARSVAAQIDRVQGRSADALKKLEPLLGQTKNPLESPFVSEAYERFTRAELLYELGRSRESLRSFDHLVESSVFEFVYLPLSHLWRAEALSRLGDAKSAASSYEAFIALWRDCDPELRPMVELARRRLQELARRTASASQK
jgi:serine/threonine protein kinase/tetratricopeptide (TPR) repeat protein